MQTDGDTLCCKHVGENMHSTQQWNIPKYVYSSLMWCKSNSGMLLKVTDKIYQMSVSSSRPHILTSCRIKELAFILHKTIQLYITFSDNLHMVKSISNKITIY